MKQIAIIGGGAAGLAAAVNVGRVAKERGGNVEAVIYEASDRVGKSILASGNGRCNFSNKNMVAEKYHGASFVAQTFQALSPQEVFELFADLGLFTLEESEGRLYPLTNKANTVLDILRFAIDDLPIHIVCGQKIQTVTPAKGSYLLTFDDDQTAFFDAVIVSCGGSIAQHILPPGYLYSDPQPMLGPLKTNTEYLKGLNNIRVKCAVRFSGKEGVVIEEGEVLFRDYGVSGIAVFNLSRHVSGGDIIHIDFLSQYTKDQLEDILRERHTQLGGRNAVEFCAGIIQSAVARAVLKRANLPTDASLSAADIPMLVHMLKDFPLTVKGIGDERQCQVKRGGFKTDGFDPSTMQSKTDRGLFVVGEALDVDGPCGGYNLHWAWTSGLLAGKNAVDVLHD